MVKQAKTAEKKTPPALASGMGSGTKTTRSGGAVISGKPCPKCGGRTYLTRFSENGSLKSARYCDSVAVVAELKSALAATTNSIKKIPADHQAAFDQAAAFEVTATGGVLELARFLGFKDSASILALKQKQIAEETEKRRKELSDAVNKTAQELEKLPALHERANELQAQIGRTNEFCRTISGWKDDRILLPPG